MNSPGLRLPLSLILIILFILQSPLSAQVHSDPRKDDHSCSIRYVRGDKTAILEAAAFMSREVSPLDPYERILVIENDSTDWLATIYPRHGFVNQHMLYTEHQLEMLYLDEVRKQSELDLVLSGRTPLRDILDGSSTLPPFDASRTWMKDDQHRVKIVNTSVLHVRYFPSHLFDTVGQVYQWDKVISDITFNRGGRWDKLVFPISGFVNNTFLLSDEEMKNLHGEQAGLISGFRQTVTSNSLAEAESMREVRIARKQHMDTEILKFESKEIIARNNLRLLSDSSVTIWWSDRVDLNQNHYPGSAKLNLRINDATIRDPFRTRIYYRKSNEEGYHPLPLGWQRVMKNGKPGSYVIGTKDHHLLKGSYNFRVEIFDQKTRDLLAVHTSLDREELRNLSFENEYINKFRLGVMMTVSPVLVPVEAIFSRLGFPYGVNLEVSRENWRFAVGYGFNTMKAVTESGTFILETQNNFLYLKLVPFRLINDHLDLFLEAGPTRWLSKVNSVNDFGHPDYFPMETQSGFHLMGGIGAQVTVRNFLLGVQYHLYGSTLAEFSLFSNPNELHMGSHQLQLSIGYSFHR